MKVDVYERGWMWIAVAMQAVFFTTISVALVRESAMPPSHTETIDPKTVLTDPRFRSPGVSQDAAGHVHARVVGVTFAWMPGELTVPAETPVTFHVTSLDVDHGFEIVRTNGQTMVLPGYVSQFTTQFAAGEYLIACNEYCGVGHHMMAAKLHVVPKGSWHAAVQAPAPNVSAAVPAGSQP